ncbi:MAG: hypothetical protein GX605_05770, partial [Chloroflexi bacterium]|nr:hypothetical protein [Chloroflexota bacterium]
AGYRLQGVTAISLAEGPLWLREPLFVEASFAPPDAAPELCYLSLRQGAVQPGAGWEVSTFLFRSEDVTSAETVEINGQPAALLALEGQPTQGRPARRPPPLRELLWQQGDTMLELSTQALDPQELLRVARSLQPLR